MAEQFAFQQVLRDGGAVDRDEGAGGALGLGVQVAGDDFLAHAALAGDQDRGVGGGHLVGHGDHRLHGRVAGDHRPVVVGHRRQHRGDQFRIGRQGDEFLGACPDGVASALGVGADAAGHHRHPDPLGLVGGDQAGDVQVVVDHQQVGALAGAQGVGGRLARLHVGDLRPRVHGHLHRAGELSAQSSDDQKPHCRSPLPTQPFRPRRRRP